MTQITECGFFLAQDNNFPSMVEFDSIEIKNIIEKKRDSSLYLREKKIKLCQYSCVLLRGENVEKNINTSLHFIMAIIGKMPAAAAAAHMSNERVITWYASTSSVQ